jgi:acyl-CoA reductase-like NAD-dependent aldehyde dehydrogenase
MTAPTLDTRILDDAVADLRAAAKSWSTTSITERIGLLERLLPRVLGCAEQMVGAAAAAKGFAPDSVWAAEDWIAGPWAVLQTAQAYLHVLRRVARGRNPLPASAVFEHAGRVGVNVFPVTGWDRILLNGYSAHVRILSGVRPEEVAAKAAAAYRGRVPKPGVALVLGAGNIAGMTALDIIHKLYVEGQVVVAKMNPVNAYLRPYYEDIFAEFIGHGWVRFVDGGAAEGAYLTRHDRIDALHVTGSARTHDAIVWGTDEMAPQRRRDDRPLVDKPFTSELGGVSPCIVVPGPWSAADYRFQAEQVVTSKLNNSGHNCIASQVLVVPREWDGTERLLQEVRVLLRTLPARADYYPGAELRLAAVRQAHPGAEVYGEGDCRLLVPDITDTAQDILITDEVFASALGIVRLGGAAPEQYLRSAVAYCNDTLPGTLGATVLVHPKTEAAHRAAVHAAIAELRYGTLGVNCWSAFGFLLGYAPWGAYPGHTRQGIGSGTGFVHNAFMLEDVEKTVVRAPFAPAPRGLVTGSPSLSPRPPYFVTNRTAQTTIKRLARFTAAPGIAKLPGIMASALRG